MTPSQAPLLPASMTILAPASLPVVPAVQSVPSAPVAVAGVLLGDGLAPLPPKLIKRIQQLEFVEMADLLPEAWLLEESTMEAQLRRQKGPVTDILVWVQCFAMFASTLGRAWRRAICQVCLSEQHATDACPKRGFTFWAITVLFHGTPGG